MNRLCSAVVLVLLASAAACTKHAPSDPLVLDGGGAPQASASAASTLSRMRTTDPSLALSNLDVQIQSREQMLARDANDVRASCALVELLLARGQYASRIADYERADTVAAAFVAAHPESGDAHLAHASTLGTFHLFPAQLAELDAAERLKASADAVRASRATISMAQGRYDDAAATGAWTNTDTLDAMGLAAAAVLAGERSMPGDSDQLFERARAKYHDVSPFPVAWMDFQRGSLLERQGDRARAKLYFAEAHTFLPGYAHAAVHLAGLETPAEALAILEPLVGKTDDPEVDSGYADALRRVGRAEDAKASIARAKVRYDELVKAHPLAFADHAAQFYLGLGHDPQRALALARQNADNRPTEPALDLLLSATLLAGSHDEACAAAARGAALRYATPAFRATVAATRASCPAP